MKRWMKYVKPYLLYFILGPLCMIIEVVGEVLMPMYLAEVINGAVKGTLTSEGSLWVMAKMIGTALIMMLGGVGGSYFGAKASVNFAADLRADLFKKVQGYSFANIDKFSTASLITRLTNDVTQVQNFVNMMLRMMLRSPGMLIGGIIMAIRLSPSLSVVMAVTLPLLLISMAFIIARGMPRFSKMQTKIDALNSTVQENITNVRVVKSFVREDFETEKFENSNKNLKGAGMSAMKNMIFMQPVQSFFMYITTGLVIWFGSILVINNFDSFGVNSAFGVGELSSFINYVTQILMSLMMVTFMLMFSSRALASAKRINEVLDEKLDIVDGENADDSVTVEKGEIEFKNVTYRYYKNSEEPVLANIDLKIAAGSTVGIIGSTGCGKTTLVSLIPRLYDTDEGEVLVDGKNVKDYTLYNLREGVGMVLQKNVLFSGTIEENLRWGKEIATDEEIFAAAESAQADKFVKNFTLGYQTELGQGGVNVSGGQKQRLCIARALLKEPKIIILDDSTSAVDTATEAQIRRAFREELAASTKIIIAQRISSVKDADMIVVMDDGKITGVGTHDYLMENNVEYQEIYNSQISGKDGN
ncbi:MAG: ABC transporter ATP-binding protein [Ruminococcaceae bacterium]|nr:ABC transporter ATP-binding protein [Oscillospiraceae bacterium]